MKEKLISEKFSFSKICGVISERNDGFTKVFHSLFDVALLFCPALKIPEAIRSSVMDQDISVSILEAKERFGAVFSNILDLVQEKSAAPYNTKYNDMVIAHFLLLFSAFYESVKLLLPDKEYHIELDDETTLYITHDAIERYAEYYANDEKKKLSIDTLPDFPHDLFSYSYHEEDLIKLYEKLSGELAHFLDIVIEDKQITSAAADMIHAKIKALPGLAKDTYYSQYFKLKDKFRIFAAYTENGEHRVICEKLERITDVLLANAKSDRERHAVSVLAAEKKYYGALIRKRILYGGSDDEYAMLPLVEDIFIPQSYKSIEHKSVGKRKPLFGPDESWKDVEEKDDLIEYIIRTVESPTFGRKPVVILGEPGGGKSTLCSILAAKVFPLQYHTIIVRLREVNANEPISAQIEQQIKRDISDDITWSEIRDCVLSTNIPLLLIFDGYDELLRAGGHDYSEFIKSVYEFQQTQDEVYSFVVRTMITSRRNLIDLAEIPNNSAIIYLQDFSAVKISGWIEKWNEHNKGYYAANGLQPFALRKYYYELAKQPLLLTMLAVYDFDSNALAHETQLSTSALYRNLLKDYVDRELRKHISEGSGERAADAERMHGYLRIAAMGMTNRGLLCITQEQLEKDLIFFGSNLPGNGTEGLKQGVKLFGSFFFVNTSRVKEAYEDSSIINHTYEFLHNTFGEYLAADFILKAYRPVLSGSAASGSVSEKESEALFRVLCFACLCEKPNILMLIHEMSIESRVPDSEGSDSFVTGELREVISGEKALRISRWLDSADIPYERYTAIRYSALYAINLISVAVSTDGDLYIQLSEAEWDLFVKFLRLGLKESELEIFCFQHFTARSTGGYKVYRSIPGPSMKDVPHAEKMHLINHILCDEVSLAFSGTVFADYLAEPYIDKHELEIKSELLYLMLLKDMYPSNKELDTLLRAQRACFREKNYHILTALYRLVQSKYAVNTVIKRMLLVFFDEGIDLFMNNAENDTGSRQYRLAFAELLNTSRLIRKIHHERFIKVQTLMGYFPIKSLEEYFSVIRFMVDCLEYVPRQKRNRETIHAVSTIMAMSNIRRFSQNLSADYLVRSMYAVADKNIIVDYHADSEEAYSVINELICFVLNYCHSLVSLSSVSKGFLLKHLHDLYFRNTDMFCDTVIRASRNKSFKGLCTYWLHKFAEYPDSVALVIIEILSLMKEYHYPVSLTTVSFALRKYEKKPYMAPDIKERIRRLSEQYDTEPDAPDADTHP